MKYSLVLLLFAATLGFSQEPKGYVIHAVPSRGKPFTMPMRDDDSIGSIYDCMKKVHRLHWYSLRSRTGVCEIPPRSIRPGKHMSLSPKYKNVFVTLN